MHSRGFPNSFFWTGSVGFNVCLFLLDEQSIHSTYPQTAKDKGAKRIEASQEAEEKWIQTIIEKARLTAEFQENCTPGYYNNEEKLTKLLKTILTAVVQ